MNSSKFNCSNYMCFLLLISIYIPLYSGRIQHYLLSTFYEMWRRVHTVVGYNFLQKFTKIFFSEFCLFLANLTIDRSDIDVPQYYFMTYLLILSSVYVTEQTNVEFICIYNQCILFTHSSLYQYVRNSFETGSCKAAKLQSLCFNV